MSRMPSLSSPATRLALAFLALEIFVVAICLGPWINDREMEYARRGAREGRLAEALDSYGKLLTRYPDSVTLNLEAGFVCLRAGRWGEAKERLLNVSRDRSAPEDIDTYIGEACMGLKDPKGAMERFQRSLQLNSGDPVANYYVGDWLYNKGELLESARHLERSVYDPKFGKAAKERLGQIEKRIFGDGASLKSKA